LECGIEIEKKEKYNAEDNGDGIVIDRKTEKQCYCQNALHCSGGNLLKTMPKTFDPALLFKNYTKNNAGG